MIEKNIHKIVIGDTSYNIVDKGISKWAKEKTKPSYTPEEVNAMGFPSYVCNEHDLIVNDFSKSGWCFIGNIIRPFDNYLTIEALEDDLIVSFSNNTIQYSTDSCQTWNELPPDTETPAINSGDKISFKATGLKPNSSNGIGTFTVNKNFNLKGNVMSMLFGDEGDNSFDLTGYDYAFANLFYDCTTLQSVSKDFLPATTLTDGCYQNMFSGCSSLVTAPELPATTLANGCYEQMFFGCSSLVTAPELPATTLSEGCYDSMFGSCSSLVTAPELPATTLAEYCYSEMFSYCESLTTSPELPATTLAEYCYSSMFSYCSSLVTAPELPATTLAYGCYNGMFQGCPSLTTAPALPVTTLTDGCYEGMFIGCTSLVTAPELPATTLADKCYSYMFFGCTSLTTAPELPATTLTYGCYNNMFQGCESLASAPELPATTLADSCYQNMFQNCSSLVTAPELPATTLAKNCYSYMFFNCESLNYIKALFTTTPGSSYTSDWVNGVSSAGTFIKNITASWDVTGNDGIPEGWTVQTDLTPIRCINLSITADDVKGRSTNTKVYWTAEVECVDDKDNNLTVTLTGTDTSESFPQNTSTTDTIERTISYTYMGVTATTTITHGVWINSEYTINLNNQWQSSSVTNPDSTLYDGVYESFSNKGVNNKAATMYIDIDGYTDFDLYIRSYAESTYDYVMVSQLDQTINNSTSYSNTTLVKAHTSGKQNGGTAIDNYTKVAFTGIDEGQHRITIVYRKDSSGNSKDDRGYVLIPKNQ